MLYHEKQVAALCGVHCLNTLLQGPYFNEIDLAQIAHNLDELERALFTDGGLGESGNVAMDGMFSIQVLSRALESWGLQVISLESEAARELKAAPTSANAFICNLSDHWFTLRRVAGDEWWNFNSLFPAPQPLSTFYLQAFLDTLRGEGWTIFVVTGQLPAAQPGSLEQPSNAPGRWWTPEEARTATEEAERARKRGRLTAALEDALARANRQGGRLQLRTRGAPARNDSGDGGGDDDDADLAAAIAASLQAYDGESAAADAPGGSQPVTRASQQPQSYQGGPAVGLPYDAYGGMHGDEDPELAMAIAASLADSAAAAMTAAATAAVASQGGAAAGSGNGGGGGGDDGGQAGTGQEGQRQQAEAQAEAGPGAEVEAGTVELGAEPEEGEGVIEVAFRLPSGGRCSRRFRADAPSAALFAFVAPSLGVPPTQIALSTPFPRKELICSPATSLEDLSLSKRTLLVAELVRR